MSFIRPEWEAAHAAVDCTTHTIQVRRRVIRGGQVTWWEQCSVCGAKFRQLKSSETPAGTRSNPVDYDEEANAAYHSRINAAVQGYYEATKEHELAERRRIYRDYLLSPEWAKRREKVLRRANGICEGCGEARATQVHHKTYDHIYNEPLFDLVAICKACHESIHQAGAA